MNGIEFFEHYDETLQPCPFCGAAPARNKIEAFTGGVYIAEKRVPESAQDFFNPSTMFTVTCRGCHAKIARANLAAVREAWNSRAR